LTPFHKGPCKPPRGESTHAVERFQNRGKFARRFRQRGRGQPPLSVFANKADIEGQSDISALFRSTAEGETGHAHGHLDYLAEVGDPATGLPMGSSHDNLKSAVTSETYEHTEMYPAMAKTAREEGFDEIADWFETLAKAERSHANRFQKALNALVD